MNLLKELRRVLRPLLLAVAAGILFIEEWGWRPLSRWLGRLAAWPPLARLEAALRRSPPRLALLLFLAPATALFPVKLLALWLIHLGHGTLGVVVILAAKLLGTALVGRLFVLTEPQLMSFPWFARAIGWWVLTRQRVKALLLDSAAWQALRRLRSRLRALLRALRR
jgi:hypothetical protein